MLPLTQVVAYKASCCGVTRVFDRAIRIELKPTRRGGGFLSLLDVRAAAVIIQKIIHLIKREININLRIKV